tara:strand:+ start:8085 stop:8318 length:234 start_codon:yes stop_codon:yes gene_type:complete
MFKYRKYYEFYNVTVHDVAINIFNRLYRLSFTIKYPSYNLEIFDNNGHKRIYETAWFSDRFENHLEDEVKKREESDD